ncbi:GNAT family N-acetyltransferase [Criibacterium bergeronii]|uniref:GNAT family N-acetyltransferase n=1 Tax=Criibacterium bergeronii TaxID=1871336 RepID=A0A371IPB2_9FIRM|nr:GNAT family N-acetyltransferase [Criibacterium bergeronii]MBS6063460.1 GNAT family N-acetyltransferase [Peptostreptococcaceae bacterium]RDY22318.1 GNAT family N-acetyltransferase [Criibacterium bergeronii]
MIKTEIYEEYLMNSYPSPFTLLDAGFILRFGGIEKLTNCVFPLYEKNDKFLTQKIIEIENILESYDLPVLYRLTSSETYQHLDRQLISRNYDRISSSVMMRCLLKGRKDELFRFANFNEIGIYTDQMSDDLLRDYFYLKDFDQQSGNIFTSSMATNPSEKFFLTLIEEKALIGQALCVKQDDVVVILDIVVNQKRRGSGYATRLLLSALTYAIRINAQIVLADVPIKNEPAYYTFTNSNMFEPVYEAYYRKK